MTCRYCPCCDIYDLQVLQSVQEGWTWEVICPALCAPSLGLKVSGLPMRLPPTNQVQMISQGCQLGTMTDITRTRCYTKMSDARAGPGFACQMCYISCQTRQDVSGGARNKKTPEESAGRHGASCLLSDDRGQYRSLHTCWLSEARVPLHHSRWQVLAGITSWRHQCDSALVMTSAFPRAEVRTADKAIAPEILYTR
ncbi:uncharacterized protein LOC112563765 isoform X2 [Pomacea canaliculata]|uniref:uncharacterized protein LOC112563765 isoform X2 n=1 Tax=Pomacea canaliculata TaxID=400727 RepID=UPI000D729DF7|nr:uncharacterized protein LOC112563765 isoform X2 [Pomacea canaliculata]